MSDGFSTKTDYQRYFTKAHDMFRKSVRELVKKEITPHIEEWEEAGTFPRELYEQAGEAGFLGVGYPEDVGGTPADVFFGVALTEELMRSTSGGLAASLGSLNIAIPPIVRHGTPEQKARFVAPVLAGKRIAALGITEPSGGSDVAGLQTTAVSDGNHYIVNGSKTFITSGIRADQLTAAVRTGGPGHGGISLLVIERDTPGYSTSPPLKKTGWWASDTAEIYFDNCRVPKANLIGEENKGFYLIMENFQAERLALAVMANSSSDIALELAVDYAKKRSAFGKPLKGFQVMRHKLVEMATLAEVSREFTYRVAAKIDAGENQVKEISMAKNFACQAAEKVTYEAMQVFGGHGYMRGNPVDRLWRDVRLLAIGGGTTEIMREIISRLMIS
jgi:acyl-CoA dehydrogenase